MKKIITIMMAALLAVAMMIGLTGCGEETTLKSQTINGITLDVPSDFGAFTEKSGLMLATNEDSTASIAVTPSKDAGGGPLMLLIKKYIKVLKWLHIQV